PKPMSNHAREIIGAESPPLQCHVRPISVPYIPLSQRHNQPAQGQERQLGVVDSAARSSRSGSAPERLSRRFRSPVSGRSPVAHAFARGDRVPIRHGKETRLRLTQNQHQKNHTKHHAKKHRDQNKTSPRCPIIHTVICRLLRIRQPPHSPGRLETQRVSDKSFDGRPCRNPLFERWFSESEFHEVSTRNTKGLTDTENQI